MRGGGGKSRDTPTTLVAKTDERSAADTMDWQGIANNVTSGVILAAVLGATAWSWNWLGKRRMQGKRRMAWQKGNARCVNIAGRVGLGEGTCDVTKEQPSERQPGSLTEATRSRGLITAETLAVATGLGYALAFIYESGLAAYYRIPFETIRVSPEWVIFIAIALVPSILGLITGITVADQIATTTPRQRTLIRVVLLVTGTVLALVSGVLGNSAWASLFLVAGVLLTSLGFADWLGSKVEARETKRSSPYVLSTVLAVSVLFVMLWMTFSGYLHAYGQTEYLVDTANQRVLVYSTDSVYVFADYDPKSAQLKPTLTYIGSGDFGTGGMTLVSTTTGRLKSVAVGQ